MEDDELNGLFKDKVLSKSKFCINMHNFDMYRCVMIELMHLCSQNGVKIC